LAKICFYCGKELNTGEKCGCRSKFNQNTNSSQYTSDNENKSNKNEDKDKEFKKRQKQFEKERKARERQRAKSEKQGSGKSYKYDRYSGNNNSGTSGSNWQPGRSSLLNFFYRFMTNQGFSKNEPFHKKAGYSLLHTFFKPVSAIDAFILNRDKSISIFYVLLFAVSGGFLSMRFLGNGPVSFLEGFLISVIFTLILTGLLLLSFRFFAKIKYSFINMLSTLSAPFIFVSLFFFIASTGRGSLFYSAATIVTGIISGSLLHFLALKKFSGLDNDRLIANIILVYFVFYSIVAFILNLALISAS